MDYSPPGSSVLLSPWVCTNELVMLSNHLILCHFLFLWSSIIPSIRVFSNEWPLHIRWPKYWSFSFSINPFNEFSSVQSLSRVWLFATPWTIARQASLSITNSRSSPKPMYIELVMSSNHLILCCPLLLLPSIFPSIRVFSNESVLCISWPKYWSFSFNISPSNEHLGLISFRMDWLDLHFNSFMNFNEYSGSIFFRMDWLDLLVVQGTLTSLLQTTFWMDKFFRPQPSLQSNSHIHTWLLEGP